MKGGEVHVSLVGRQVDAAGEESRIALSVTGRRFLRGDSRYVSYDDTELIEGETVPTVLRFGADQILLQRRGIVRFAQHFMPGKELPHAVWDALYHDADTASADAQGGGRCGGGVHFLHALCGRCTPKR